jgi:probable F420-dependent oxidoreductase
VRFGLTIFPTDYSIGPAELGRAAEDAGFEALLFAEHTHIPASLDSQRPHGGKLPRRYWHTLDPFVALAAVATVTERLRVGTGICLVVERDPITTAKEVASVDLLSNGRFEFGVGAGWNREEMRNHGTDPATRFSLMRERVEAMKAIWSQEEATYHGKHVSFERIWSWPKPVQQPHPPILVGGTGPKALDRVLGYGDVWMPNRVAEPADLKPRIAELRERAGRHFPVTYFGADPTDEFVSALADAGVDRALLQLPDGDADTVLPLVEQYAELAARHR